MPKAVAATEKTDESLIALVNREDKENKNFAGMRN